LARSWQLLRMSRVHLSTFCSLQRFVAFVFAICVWWSCCVLIFKLLKSDEVMSDHEGLVVGTSKQKHRCLPTSMFKKFGIDGRYIVRETSIFHKHRYFGLWYGTKTRSSLNKCVIFPNDKKSNKNKMRNSVNN
jgi:hypothetical protein